METYFLKDDIKLICVSATSFPGGIKEAHEKLHGLFPSTDNRKVFGVSHPERNSKITYKVGVEEAFAGEGYLKKLEEFVLKKGQYKGTRIVNYQDHIESISKTFEKILNDPKVDSQGCCIEVYLNEKDVQCMVRLESRNNKL